MNLQTVRALTWDQNVSWKGEQPGAAFERGEPRRRSLLCAASRTSAQPLPPQTVCATRRATHPTAECFWRLRGD